MTKVEKIAFIEDVIANIKNSVLKKADKFPEEWGGVELRWLLMDYFDVEIRPELWSVTNKRHDDYRNEVLVRNL